MSILIDLIVRRSSQVSGQWLVSRQLLHRHCHYWFGTMSRQLFRALNHQFMNAAIHTPETRGSKQSSGSKLLSQFCSFLILSFSFLLTFGLTLGEIGHQSHLFEHFWVLRDSRGVNEKCISHHSELAKCFSSRVPPGVGFGWRMICHRGWQFLTSQRSG